MFDGDIDLSNDSPIGSMTIVTVYCMCRFIVVTEVFTEMRKGGGSAEFTMDQVGGGVWSKVARLCHS